MRPYSPSMATNIARRRRKASAASDDIFDLMGRSENIREAADAMQAMGHPLRLKILCLVGGEELSVLEIVEAVGTTQSNVSQHLALLREHGVLEARKEANKVFYRVGDQRVIKLIALMREIFCRQ